MNGPVMYSQFLLGIPVVDEEHITLIKLAESKQLIGDNCSESDIKQVFGELYEYVLTHLHHEEELIMGWVGYRSHVQMHKALVFELDNIFAKQLKAHGSELRGIAKELNVFIMKWLVTHIFVQDSQFVPYLKSEGY